MPNSYTHKRMQTFSYQLLLPSTVQQLIWSHLAERFTVVLTGSATPPLARGVHSTQCSMLKSKESAVSDVGMPHFGSGRYKGSVQSVSWVCARSPLAMYKTRCSKPFKNLAIDLPSWLLRQLQKMSIHILYYTC